MINNITKRKTALLKKVEKIKKILGENFSHLGDRLIIFLSENAFQIQILSKHTSLIVGAFSGAICW